MNKKICIVYTHHKLGDLIWQLPYVHAISEHHEGKIDLIVRNKTQAKNILNETKKNYSILKSSILTKEIKSEEAA